MRAIFRNHIASAMIKRGSAWLRAFQVLLRHLIVRLAFSFTLLILSTVAVFTLLSANQEAARLRAELQQQALVLGDYVADSTAGYTLARDYTSIETLLMRAARFPSVDSIQIIDTQSYVLGDVVNTEGSIETRYGTEAFKQPGELKRQLAFGERSLTLLQPIMQGDCVGWLKIRFNMQLVEQKTSAIWRKSVRDGVLLTLLSIVMLFVVLRRPLFSILKYMRFAEKLDHRVGGQLRVDESSLELAKLGHALNRASANLYRNHKELAHALKKFERVASMAEFSPDMVISIGKKGDIQYMNARTRLLLREFPHARNNPLQLLPSTIQQILDRCHETPALSGVEWPIGDRTFLWKFSPFRQQQVLHCYGIEITDRKKAELALRESETRYRSLFDTAHDGILLLRDSIVFDCNPSAAVLFGCSVPELIHRSVRDLSTFLQLHGRDSIRMWDQYLALAKAGTAQSFEWKFKPVDGAEFDAEVNLSSAMLEGAQYDLAIVRNITSRKEAEAKLIKQANFDTLTGLPNRGLAFDRMDLAIRHAHRLKQSVGVLFIDVDHFKAVNDTLGHAMGDQLLIEVARRLQTCVREIDTVARLGGDEFLVILSELRNPIDSEPIAEKILDVLTKPFSLGSQEFFLSASVGITTYPDDGKDPNVLLRNADAAMYKAKESGRNNYCFYTPEINQQAKERVRIESLLRRALDRKEFFLVFQPQIDMRTQRVVGAEALLRWHSKELGLISPTQFIHLAEDTGLIVPIGEWAIRTACQEAKTWHKQRGLPLRISVNISQRQFRDGNLVQIVVDALKNAQLQADCLELEITESLLIDDDPTVLKTIMDLKQLGVTLALDDFGTGYSSLSYLKRLPFDVLKIDRTFVRDITTDPDDAALCEAIMAIAASLDLIVVGEGVETKAQMEFLKFLGIHFVQGFYFSKPLGGREFNQYIERHATTNMVTGV